MTFTYCTAADLDGEEKKKNEIEGRKMKIFSGEPWNIAVEDLLCRETMLRLIDILKHYQLSLDLYMQSSY